MLRHGQQYSLTFEWLLFTAMLDLTQNTIDNSWNDHGGLCLFPDRFNGKMESWLPTRPCVCSARLLLNLTAFALSLLESSAAPWIWCFCSSRLAVRCHQQYCFLFCHCPAACLAPLAPSSSSAEDVDIFSTDWRCQQLLWLQPFLF